MLALILGLAVVLGDEPKDEPKQLSPAEIKQIYFFWMKVKGGGKDVEPLQQKYPYRTVAQKFGITEDEARQAIHDYQVENAKAIKGRRDKKEADRLATIRQERLDEQAREDAAKREREEREKQFKRELEQHEVDLRQHREDAYRTMVLALEVAKTTDKFRGIDVYTVDVTEPRFNGSYHVFFVRNSSTGIASTVTFMIITRSKEWEHLKHEELRRLTLIADGERINLGTCDHDGDVRNGYVTETMTYKVPDEDVAKILTSKRVDAQLGITEFKFNAQLLTAFQNIAIAKQSPVFASIRPVDRSNDLAYEASLSAKPARQGVNPIPMRPNTRSTLRSRPR